MVLRHTNPQKTYVSLVALVLIWPTTYKWQAKSSLEIFISVTDDDEAVNIDVARRWVLGTVRSRVVVEVFKCCSKSSFPTQRNLPENNCAIWVPSVLSKDIKQRE